MTISVISGGCGFIGSHHVDLLVKHGHEVRIIDDLSAGTLDNIKQHKNNHRVHFYQQDITALDHNSGIFKSADYVFHFAGIPSIRPSLEAPCPYIATNVYGTVKMLEAARHAKVKKFVYAASSACYGESDIHPTPETARINLQHPYGLSKHQGEEVVMHWGECFGLPVISLRMFDVYGQRAKSVVLNIFLKQMADGKPITICGDGNQTRDFVHVKDVCRAYLMAAQSGVKGEIFNVGTGTGQTINHLVNLIGGEKTYIPPRGNEPYTHCADVTKIKAALGWEPKINFEDGIAEIVENIKSSKAA